MESKERVRRAIRHETVDRVPAAFGAVQPVVDRLLREYQYQSVDQLYERYQIDIIPAEAVYIGPPLKSYRNADGELVEETYWGFEKTWNITDHDRYSITTSFPLDGVESIKQVDAASFPDPDWFDYSAIQETCRRHKDKAIIVGHEGPFQMVTNLIPMDQFFVLMMDEPETAHRILERMHEFEMQYYERMFQAAEGGIDILRPHDDYGTQISLLFSVDMWKEFFEQNTRELVELAHRHGAFYQQHSCGAVGPLIPEFIRIGVDVLEPIQKVAGLELETLREKYKGQIAFHGGIDTQWLLPSGTPEMVRQESERWIRVLGENGGYILMASQSFETDVPTENIEAVYAANRQ